MKKSVIYIHGGDSFGNYEDFLQHLRTRTIRDLPWSTSLPSWKRSLPVDLGEDFEVFLPSMPNSHNARYIEWKIWFERYFDYLHDGVILIGCSLGGMFLAKYLSENTLPVKVAALYLLAAPSGEFVYDPKDGDCTDFTFSSTDWATVGEKVPKIHIWHSEDDFVVPVAEAYWYKKHLPVAELRIFKDKNHFLLPDLPEILKSVRNL